MGKFNLLVFAAVFFGAVVLGLLVEHLASRGADPVKALKVRAAARLLLPFYAVCFLMLFMMPSSLQLDIFWIERNIKTVDDLVPFLKRQSEALVSMREILYWFLFFCMIYVGPTLYGLFKNVIGIEDRPNDSIPH